MPELCELSSIGFGCYRVGTSDPLHRASLELAIERGCNLIDTAATYSHGDSERLAGAVALAHPRRPLFVITKAGYVTGENASLMEDLNREGKATADLVRKADGSLHSIHPEFLEASIYRSLQRLNRSWIDAFLLHNPEYYFDQVADVPTRSGYYSRIRKAFELLEALVDRGVIRYYGVSSNALPFGGNGERTTNFFRILEVAKQVSSRHHFRFVQFPFNVYEDHAQKALHDGVSLIEAARSSQVVTISNRPLNANSANHGIRLADRRDEPGEADEKREQALLEQFLHSIQTRLEEIGAEEKAMDFTPVQVIVHGLRSFGSPDVVDQVFEHRLAPFLARLYEDEMGGSVAKQIEDLRQTAASHAARAAAGQAKAVRERLVGEGIIDAMDSRSLSRIVCERYLNQGIDHVLVGMRRPAYVEDLAPLLRHNLRSAREPVSR
jgi:aryl-alcohol dehydrogenase-like predicted oxidoreductase